MEKFEKLAPSTEEQSEIWSHARRHLRPDTTFRTKPTEIYQHVTSEGSKLSQIQPLLSTYSPKDLDTPIPPARQLLTQRSYSTRYPNPAS